MNLYLLRIKNRAEFPKLYEELQELLRTDEDFRFWAFPDTGEALIGGTSELHLEIKCALLAEAGLEFVVPKGRTSFANLESLLISTGDRNLLFPNSQDHNSC